MHVTTREYLLGFDVAWTTHSYKAYLMSCLIMTHPMIPPLGLKLKYVRGASSTNSIQMLVVCYFV
jgi:hypothetical protein